MTASRLALVTGFAPFGGDARNPSAEIALSLHGELLGGTRVIGAVLPTEFATSLASMQSLIEQHRPALVLALGLAGGRAEIALERVAINLIDARIADNAGAQPIDVPVIAGAPAAYFSNLPLKLLLRQLHALGILATISHSAGTFVCNQVFFGLMDLLATRYPALLGGFVHVPYLPEQVQAGTSTPSLALEQQQSAIRAILRHAFDADTASPISAGSTH